MKRSAEEMCMSGWYGSAIFRERLRQQLLRGIPQNDHVALHTAFEKLRLHLEMLEWCPDPSRMEVPNGARFLQWVPAATTWRAMDVDPLRPKLRSMQ
eukprot:1687465-Pyramimonas_sp.AAC.1